MRRAPRLDSNHTAVVDAFRRLGCSVLSLAAMGKGCPDLVVARGGVTALVEVKDGTKPPSERKLTPDQQLFHAAWRGRIFIVESADQVPAVFGELA